MAAGQVRGLRAGLRPVAGSRPDMRRELALGHRHPGQARAAAAARRRRAVIALIRVIDQAHRHPGITRLLTRPPLPPLPQRPIRAPLLLLMRAIRGRRARGRGRVLARPPLKLINPRRKPLVQRGQPLNLPGQLSDQPPAAPPARRPAARTAAQPRAGQERRTQLAMITIPARQSTTRPGGAMILRAMIALVTRRPRCDRALKITHPVSRIDLQQPGHRGAPVPGGRA